MPSPSLFTTRERGEGWGEELFDAPLFNSLPNRPSGESENSALADKFLPFFLQRVPSVDFLPIL